MFNCMISLKLIGQREIKRRLKMQSKLYVGNINYSVTADQLKTLFSTYGEVKDVKIIEGKGFAFVEMTNQADAEKAKKALNSTVFEGRNLNVDEAKPPRDRDDRQRRPSFGSRRY